MNPLPRVLLIDLDDTILDDSASLETAWDGVAESFGPRTGAPPARLRAAVDAERAWYWADEARHRRGRLDLLRARTEVCMGALRRLGRDDGVTAAAMARDYGALRDETLRPFPGAVEALAEFRRRGIRLAMITNGAGSYQRRKIARFELAPHFEAILVEGEVGYGKPDPRVFRRALGLLDVKPSDAWMVGDDLARDVAGAKSVGVRAVWVDARGRGLPADAAARPDRVVRSLAELAG